MDGGCPADVHLRTFSSVGQRDRLITGKSQVRVLQGPLRKYAKERNKVMRKYEFTGETKQVQLLFSVATLTESELS